MFCFLFHTVKSLSSNIEALKKEVEFFSNSSYGSKIQRKSFTGQTDCKYKLRNDKWVIISYEVYIITCACCSWPFVCVDKEINLVHTYRMEHQMSIPLKQRWSQARDETRHFPILDFWGGGYKFPIYFVQDWQILYFKLIGFESAEKQTLSPE